MKRQLFLAVSLAALILFLAVQIFLIVSTWRQKEEIIMMRYSTLTRDGLSYLITERKSDGFEQAMDVTDRFADYLINEELPTLGDESDSTALGRLALTEVYSILRDNELLTSFYRSFIGSAGYDTDFISHIAIAHLGLLTPGGLMVLADTSYLRPARNMIVVNTFREEHNNFMIEFHYLLDLTHRNRLVFREALASLALITASMVIVLFLLALAWRSLLEERRLSELKSDFINNMTHELKTPLATITVAGKALQKEQVAADPQKVIETAELISKQSLHLNQLINTILDISLLEREEFQPDRSRVVISELMQQIVASFLTSCDQCAVITGEYGTGKREAEVDVPYFTAMITNLLSNAVKYCDGKPEIRVSANLSGDDIVITVTDNGTGIPSEHLGHIFDKFYRVPTGNIHKTKGLGLGLYYVRRIAAAHGGEITVTSRPGRGTTFTITIPNH